MSSKEYWRRREENALKQYQKDEKEYDRQLKRIYQNQLDAIQTQINDFYGRYASKEGVTIAEAKKRVSKLDIEAYQRKAAKYVAERNFSDKANEEMRLYNLTMKVNRLEMLKANIGLETIAGADELDKFMGKILKGRTEDELKRQAGILGKTIRNNAELAKVIPNASFHNATFSDRIWMYQDLLKNELSGLLQSGLIQGKNPRVLAKELKKKIDTSTFNAERLMRTELARVQTEAQKQSLERNGFEYYEFIANSGCCDDCQKLNGKHFKVKDMMPGENAPPCHPLCRCSTAPWEDSEEYEAWLDHIDKGGSTKEWEDHGKAEWEKQQAKKASPKVQKAQQVKATTAGKTDKQKTQPREATKKPKAAPTREKSYTAKDLDKMSLAQLKKIAEKMAAEYYKSGASGINFNGADVEEVAKSLAAKGSKTSLKKDILSIQKRKKAAKPVEKPGKSSKIIVGKSVGAASKNYPVKLPESKQHTKLAEGQEISGTAFAGKGTKIKIRDRFRLESEYKIPADKWKKVSGIGYVIVGGKKVKAELHWYEADGEIVEMKVKRYLDDES